MTSDENTHEKHGIRGGTEAVDKVRDAVDQEDDKDDE